MTPFSNFTGYFPDVGRRSVHSTFLVVSLQKEAGSVNAYEGLISIISQQIFHWANGNDNEETDAEILAHESTGPRHYKARRLGFYTRLATSTFRIRINNISSLNYCHRRLWITANYGRHVTIIASPMTRRQLFFFLFFAFLDGIAAIQLRQQHQQPPQWH